MGNVTLKVPGLAVTVAWLGQSHRTGLPRAQVLDEAFDGPIFPRGIPPLEKDTNLDIMLDDMTLQFYQLHLQLVEQLSIFLLSYPLVHQYIATLHSAIAPKNAERRHWFLLIFRNFLLFCLFFLFLMILTHSKRYRFTLTRNRT